MHNKKHQDFLSRLREIINDRDEYPWGMRLGFSRGTIHRLFVEGKVPGPEFLVAIAQAERVDLNWLLIGVGGPYRVRRCLNGNETAEAIQCLINDYPQSWTVYLGSDGQRQALVLVRDDQYELKGQWVDYTHTEVIAGPVGRLAAVRLAESVGPAVRAVALDAATMNRLCAGQMGTYELIRDDGILERYTRVDLSESVVDGERDGDSVGADERVLLECYRVLEPAEKERLTRICDILKPWPDKTL